jgi:hypothetical protein
MVESNLELMGSSIKNWILCMPMLVPERKLSFSPISASDSNFNPRNTQCMSVVKIFLFLDLNEKF